MTIALLATGDEIIHGDTLNTNSYHLAQILSSEGLPLGLQLACSDKEEEIYQSIRFLAAEHDIIILIGGLGPTSDDRTRFALERFLQTQFVAFPEALNHIQKRLHNANLELNLANRQQALFPEGAGLLPNPNGTAMGCYYQSNDKIFVLLPGPPRECLPMFNQYALPRLQALKHSDKQIFKWRLFGVAESQIAQQLDEALAGIECKTGYRLETPYVEFKVRCKPQMATQIKHLLEPIIRPHLITTTNLKASEQLALLISSLKQPITIHDEVTGGLLQTLIQQPTNYQWLKFNSPSQNDSLYFHLQGLNEYWTEQVSMGKTSLSICYSGMDGKGEGQELHELPYRSSLVIYFAAEWLSFRLIHLINQLHESIG